MSTVSFSFNVREEISRSLPKRDCCKESMLAAVLFSGYKTASIDSQEYLEVTTGLSRGGRLIYSLAKEITKDLVKWEASREKILSKRQIYRIFIPKNIRIQEYIKQWGIDKKIHKAKIRKACCRRSFLKGVFLSSGSVNSPESHYHLEITQKDYNIVKVVLKILSKMEINAKTTQRRGKHVVYIKKADEIANLLNIFGAYNSLLKFEEVRVIKETKKKVRRRVNAETSNMDKRALAATRQIYLIKRIQKEGLFYNLPEILQKTADLRMKYPEASLLELGGKFSPPISKSSVNNRLRRLESIAHNIIDKKID